MAKFVSKENLQEIVKKVAKKEEGVFFVQGLTTTTAGTWEGTNSRITSYYDGLTINFKVGVAGADTTTLNINGLGAKTCYLRGTTKITTHYAVGTMVILSYNATTDAFYSSDYDANNYAYARQYGNITTNAEYPVLFSQNKTVPETYTNRYTASQAGFTYNPSTKTMTLPTLKATTIYENGTSLANKYIGKTGDETISGYKQFDDAMYIKGGTSAPTMTNLGAYIYADGNRTHLNLRGAFGSNIYFNDEELSLAYSSLVNTFDINSKTKDGFKMQINSKEVATKDMIPTVNNATLTIQKNGTNVATFTSNASSNATANITVPTALSEMTQSASYRTVTDTEKSTWNAKSNFSGSYTDLTNKPTIPTNTNQLTNGAGFVTSSGSVASATNATKLNNQEASYYLNYNNLSNKPTIPSLASVLLWQNASPSSEMGETTITLSKSLVSGKNYAIYYKYQNTAVSKIKLEFKYGGTGYIGWLNMYDTSSSGNYLKNRLVEITASNKIKFYKNYTNANVYAASLIPTEIYELPN